MTVTPLLWILGFIPALIALYFLKLKRRERVVSSTLLWSRSLEELHVNAPFQKLRRSLLLLLQFLVLAGLILSLWRPRTVGELVSGENLIVLVDTSASMGAREETGTRLDEAKRHAGELVHAMKEGDRMALLTFAAETTTLVPLTEDTNTLLAAIETIEVTAAPTNLVEALVVAGSLAASLFSGKVYVLGDGCYAENLELPDEIKRQRVEFFSAATHRENVAITELDVRQTFETDQRTEIFAAVENTGLQPWSGTVSVYFEDELKDARELTLEAGQSAPLLLDGSAYDDGIVRVVLDAEDGLEDDNQAWVRIRPPKPVKVLLVGRENQWIELVLRTSRRSSYEHMSTARYTDLVKGMVPEDAGEKLGADVLLFDGEAPPGPPLLPAIYVGCYPSLPEGTSAPEEVEEPIIIDWDRAHPVNRLVVFTGVFIESGFVFKSGPRFRGLVESDQGSLIGTVRDRVPGRRPVSAVVVGFDILKSNWPVGHYSFVIFFSNALSWLNQENQGVERARHRSGEPLVYRPADEVMDRFWSEARIRTPSGELRVPGKDENGALVLAAPKEVGVYEVVLGGETLARLPVALLNAGESRLKPREKISFGEFEVAVKTEMEQGTRHLWKWFALAALAFLFVEWYVYNRRLGY